MAKANNGLGTVTVARLLATYNPNLTDAEMEPGGGRILALDVGKKRIGLAMSDALGITAQGLETLRRTRIRADIQALREVTKRWSIKTLLVGRPLHMSGDESKQSEYTRVFAERLGQDLGLPVVYWDERLTSMEAERALREAGASLEERKKAVDRMAAVLLLESYLDYLRNAAHAGTEDSIE